MHFSLLSAALVAATTIVHASPLQPRTDYNVAQLRLYSSSTCAQDGNQGEWTIHNATGELNTCTVIPPLVFAGEDYLSIIETGASSDPAWASCVTTLYTDAACAVERTELVVGVCVNAPADAPAGWGSFEVAC